MAEIAANPSASATMNLVNMVILVVLKPESGFCELDRGTRYLIPHWHLNEDRAR
jgi:hypothetical protein